MARGREDPDGASAPGAAAKKNAIDYFCSIAFALTTFDERERQFSTVMLHDVRALEHCCNREPCQRSHPRSLGYRCGTCLRRTLRHLFDALNVPE